jgi:DNA-binding transcriptional LysR family regulator
MLNIPTELLRTLVAVVDLRSFTKAAQVLRVTQPAVSAQIKRLQSLLGYELLDKSAPGLSLTSRGEMVVGHARRMLMINDQIAQLGGGRVAASTLRVGMPGDFAGVALPAVLVEFRKRWPDIRFKTAVANTEAMLHALRQGDLDLCVTMSDAKPAGDAHRSWTDQAVWVRSDATRLDADGPVPLISFGEDCPCRRAAVSALNGVGRECDFVFTSRSLASVEAAVLAGLGVMVLPKSRVPLTGLSIWEDAPLPELPLLHCGIYLREGGVRTEALDELADMIAGALRPELELNGAVAASGPIPKFANR